MQEELYNKLNRNYTLDEVQGYVKKVIKLRGLENKKVEQVMLLLIEEVGELAKAIRKENTNMKIDGKKEYNYDTVESEIADVFIVLNSLCNLLDINLFEALKEKESINVARKWK